VRRTANVEEATAVVMRHGCQRGESFEGCECAAGDGACEARPSGTGFHESETQRILFGTGVQQTQNLQRAQAAEVVQNHEGGTCERLVAARTRPGVESWSGEGPLQAYRWQDVHADESHDRRMLRGIPADWGFPEGEGKIKRELASFNPIGNQRAPSRDNP